MDAGKVLAPKMIADTPKPAQRPPIKDIIMSLRDIKIKFEDIIRKKISTLINILKKDISWDEAKCSYFLVIKFVTAIKTAPIKTSNTPKNDIDFVPKGSEDMMIPVNPIIKAMTLMLFILSFRKKWESTNKIKGELNKTEYTTDKGILVTPLKTNKKPPAWRKPLTIWNLKFCFFKKTKPWFFITKKLIGSSENNEFKNNNWNLLLFFSI